MSDDIGENVNDDDELRAMLALAAVNALEPDEEEALHAALADRPDLAGELEELRAAAATMAAAVAETPPPSVRAGVLAAIAADRPDSRTDGLPGDRPDAGAGSAPAPSNVTPLASRRWRKVALAAAAAVVVVASATVATRVLDDSRADDIAAVLDDADAVTVTLTGDIGELDVVYSADTQRAVMTGDDVATLADDQVYELWTQPPGGDEMVSVGTFRPDADGVVESLMEDIELAPAALLAVTVEPSGGSEVPTLPTVAVSA